VRLKSPKLTDRLRNSVGSEFQTVGPATEKARRPNVIRRQRGTVSWCWLADRRCRLLTAVTGMQCTPKYFGALFSRHRRTMTAILYWTRSGTLSQCNWSESRLDSPRSYNTCECLRRDELLHSAHVVKCQLWTSAIRQELRYSSPCAK